MASMILCHNVNDVTINNVNNEYRISSNKRPQHLLNFEIVRWGTY